ncbi:MAG: hypothetical protein VYA34_12480 [Myxococcota bacterium]|nr:hypothetical protein [Myxococcota bacterium]
MKLFESGQIDAIFCSDFVHGFPAWVKIWNQFGAQTSVFGLTHRLSYRRFTGAVFDLLTSRVAEGDGILCTSQSASDVLDRLFLKVSKFLLGHRGNRS